MKIIHICLIVIFMTFTACVPKIRGNAVSESTVSTPSPTPDLTASRFDGYWENACQVNGNAGMRLAVKISDAHFSSRVLVTYQRPDCSGNPAIIDIDNFIPANDYPTGNPMIENDVAGIPEHFSLWSDAVVVYEIDDTHIQLFILATSTNFGSQWSDWLAGESDLAGFVANPTTFVPVLVNSYNIALTKAGTVFTPEPTLTLTTVAGAWWSDCIINNADSYKWRYLFESNGNVTNSKHTWVGNTTCSGVPTNHMNPFYIGYSIGTEVGNGLYNADMTVTGLGNFYSIIQKSGDYLFLGMQGGATDNGTSLPNRHTVLDINTPYLLEAPLTNADLQGTWISNCIDNNNGTSDKLTFIGSNADHFSSVTEHWNSNGTCSGGPADVTDAPMTGTYQVGAPTNEGHAWDVHVTGGGTIYQNVIKIGNHFYGSRDDGLGNDGTTAPKRANLANWNLVYTKQ